MLQMPDEQAAWRGILGMAANGVAGAIGLAVAAGLRIRNLHAFGFTAAERRWLIIAAVCGVLAFGGCFVIEGIYARFIVEANTQGDFEAAAQGGIVQLSALLLTGALLTPFGEELLFRGVIANALNRYGAWAGVVGSAAIFAVVHGPSVILLNAFMIGLIAGVLFRRTGSIWPCVVVHAVYNGLNLLYYATL